MRLLNTCAIVNGLVDGWKGMGNGGSRSRSSLSEERARRGGDGSDAKEMRRDVSRMNRDDLSVLCD